MDGILQRNDELALMFFTDQIEVNGRRIRCVLWQDN